MKRKKLIREQMETTLRRFGPLSEVRVPHKGWIRAVRDALGMTAKQLGRRMGVAQQAAARIERDELAGAVTIRTMQRVAEGLDCNFVYGFVPHSTLDATLRKQARTVAAKRLAQANQTMALEAQALSKQENRRVLSEMIDELADTVPSHLWDEL
jgi:predicted DNA-binding mobile mystery protein A